MILHFIILNRQQRTAFALSSTPPLFSLCLSTKQPDGSLLCWLAVSSSVCVCSLQCTPWLAVVQGKIVVWLVEGAQWNMNLVQVCCCIIFSLPTTNQVKVTHVTDFSTSFVSGLPFSYHIHTIQQRRQWVLFQHWGGHIFSGGPDQSHFTASYTSSPVFWWMFMHQF